MVRLHEDDGALDRAQWRDTTMEERIAAIWDRLSYEAHVVAAIEQGLADADAGRVIDDEDLEGVLAARIGDLAG